MATLYDLLDGFAALLDSIESGELDDAQMADALNDLREYGSDINAKADGYARAIKNREADIKSLTAEIKRLSERKKTLEASVAWMKDALLHTMNVVGKDTIQTSIGKFRTHLNPWSCDVIDPDKVPQEYHVKQPDTINKLALLEHFRETGEIIDGVEFQRKQSINFR